MSPPAADVRQGVALFERLPAPIVLLDAATGAVRFANAPAGPHVEALDAAGLLARAAAGERLHNVLVRAGERRLLADSGPLELGGEALVVVELRDVTEIEADRRRHRALAEATRAVAASQDYDDTLRTIAHLLVPEVADWCFVELLQPDGSIERRVILAADPTKHAIAHRFDRRFPLDPGAPVGSPAVIRTGEPELVPDLPVEFLQAAAQDAEHLQLLQALDFRSVLIVPLWVDGEVVGDLALAQSESGRRFGPEDLAQVQELATRCSLLLALQRREAAAIAAREELAAIIEGVADAVVAQAPGGQIVFANTAAVDLLGYPSADALLAADLAEVQARHRFVTDDGRPLPVEDLPGRRALRGEPGDPVIVRLGAEHGGRERWLRIKARALPGEGGRPRLAITVLEDVTDIKQAEHGQRFLAEASRVLAGSLDYGRTLTQVAALAVPEIADWCVVHLVTTDGLVPVAVHSADPARLRLLEELAHSHPPDPSGTGVLDVLATGEPLIVPAVDHAVLGRRAVGEAHLRLMAEAGMVSWMVVPMRLRAEVLGTMSFVTAESGRRLGEPELVLATDLATRAATAVDNARLYQERSAIAHTLQASLLPPELPAIEGLDCAAVFRAAGDALDVGGDFYDVFDTSADEWFAVIGDVCGKGAEAAATTALVRYTVRAAAVRRRSPARILEFLNEAMLRQAGDRPRFCTVAITRLDLGGDGVRLTAACGGHPLPRVVRTDGAVDAVGEPGTVIGVTRDVHVRDGGSALQPGDALVLYTDGLTEAAAPSRVWSPADLDAALREAHASAGASTRRLVERLASAALGDKEADPRDDIAVLGLRRAA